MRNKSYFSDFIAVSKQFCEKYYIVLIIIYRGQFHKLSPGIIVMKTMRSA